MSELIRIDKEYARWISDISKRFRLSQLKASVMVNGEMLRFYWLLGHDISTRERNCDYGKAFVKNLSLDLQEKMPDVKSFSVTNLHYMKWFYELYSTAINLPQAGVDFIEDDSNHSGEEVEQSIFFIPWGHGTARDIYCCSGWDPSKKRR